MRERIEAKLKQSQEQLAIWQRNLAQAQEQVNVWRGMVQAYAGLLTEDVPVVMEEGQFEEVD